MKANTKYSFNLPNSRDNDEKVPVLVAEILVDL
jgi:hypothetical protein